MDRIVPNLLRRYRSRVASPVIVEARANMFSKVRSALREIVPVNLLEPRFHTFLPRITKLIEFPFAKWKEMKTFNMVATLLTPNLIEEVAAWREVEKIYPDYVKYALSTVPPAGIFKDQRGRIFTSTYWTKRALGLDVANRQGLTGRGINAVVIDTGSRITHPQLRRVRVLSAMREKGGSGQDSNGHGSWCVATVGGSYAIDRRYYAPVEGMAPESSLFSIQALGFVIGMGTSSDIIQAMEMCIGLDAKVVSMSLGSDDAPKDEDNPEAKAINELVSRGIVPCVAAGNCLPANTWILTPSGHQTIHNLYQKRGGEVINYNRNEKKFENDRITGVYKREANGEEIYRIHTNEGHTIEATENHPFLTNDGWKNANELKEGDVLFVKPDTPKKFKIPDFYGSANPFFGKEPWNKGLKGIHLSPSTEFKKGNVPPFKGKRLPEDVKIKISESRKGKGIKKQIIKICEFCGAKFNVLPHDRTRRFCSPRCTKRWQKDKRHSPRTEFKSGHIPWNKGKKGCITGRFGAEALRKWQRNHPALFKQKSRLGAINLRRKGSKIRPTSIELILRKLVDSLGINFEPEYPIQFNGILTIADVAIPDRKIALYADGEYWHKDTKDKDEEINQALRKYGWKVLRFQGKELRENPERCGDVIARLLVNGAQIVKVERTKKEHVYDISTERNHTLIANGLILHNSGPDSQTIGSPGSCLNSLTVGSISPFTGEISDFSSRGPTAGDRYVKPDVVAPGERINSALVGFLDTMVDPTQTRFGPISGTSMATPHVAGLVTCMAQLYRQKIGKELTVQEVKKMMAQLGHEKNNDTGWGLINWDKVETWVSTNYGIKL